MQFYIGTCSIPLTQVPLNGSEVSAFVHDIVARGKVGARLYKGELRARDRELAPPLMWSWHGKRYLGGAHGVGQ